MKNPFRLVHLLWRSRSAAGYATVQRLPGMEFNRFGVGLGGRLLLKGYFRAISYLLTPVSSVRYFEFPFALAGLPTAPARCLDVSSPRLFSLYVATHFPKCRIHMMNPDRSDIEETQLIAAKLKLPNITASVDLVETLSVSGLSYDCVWSLSVVEHMAGDKADTEGVRAMFSVLRTGGRLILTVPVDRSFWEEYRDRDCYGTGGRKSNGRFFFQRYYDQESLFRRLIDPLAAKISSIRWFGERVPGRFEAYERRWLTEGYECTVDDPREIVDYYREYPSWEAMPGRGVCGLVIEKSERQ